MTACETLLIRDGNLIIRSGFLLLCDEVSVQSGTAGGLGLPGARNELDKRKQEVDIAAAELLLLSLTRLRRDG